MAPPGHVVVDLTLHDDDDGNAGGNQQQHDTRRDVAPKTTASPRARPVPQLNSISQTPDEHNPQNTSNADRIQLNINGDGFPQPRAKRRKTSAGVSEKGPYARFFDWITRKILPRLDELQQELAVAYDSQHQSKLHYTVYSSVLKLLESEWQRTSGHISQTVEDSIYAKARELFIELKDCPERLLSPPTSRRNPPAVLPSIEAESDRQILASTTEQEPGWIADPGEEVEEAGARSNTTDDGHIASIRAPCPPKKASPVTPQRLRARVKATQWQSGRVVEDKGPHTASTNTWFSLSRRPYLRYYERQELNSRSHLLHVGDAEIQQPLVVHVDFSDSEIRYLHYVVMRHFGQRRTTRSIIDDLRHCLKKAEKVDRREELLDLHRDGYRDFGQPPVAPRTRTPDDIENFMVDLHVRRLREGPSRTISISRDEMNGQSEASRANYVSSLLFARETVGNRAFSLRHYENFSTAFNTSHEDALEPQIEWTNCAGDIMTLNWVSKTQFLCGTTTHSDDHNQQYNKPGNLLLGSSEGTLRALPDHRIPRPIVARGDNALDSMVESQDPWLFSSVVDSDYDPSRNLAFTASFDKTVKIWRIHEDSNTMEAIGTWEHEGRVNFVLCSKHPSGLVATAVDVLSEAVRVYNIGEDLSTFDSYSCTKIHEEDYAPSEKWAYCPAAIRWGLAPSIQHLLLIGYSPRSFTGDDRDVPEDKLSTGELCLWNTILKTQIKVNSLATQNVFEVVWHPSRNSFAVATSKAQTLEKIEQHVKTQIRIFDLNSDGQYGVTKTLDCPGIDINELVLRPNSLVYSYVAAGCTDGNVYVWDTAGGDLPICVLQHGEPVEELIGEKEVEDVGVKFISWGTTADRLYTGPSDGVVKVWNIRHGKSVHLRDLIEVPGPITAGAFSPDFTKLVVGDGSGRVYMLSLEDKTENAQPSGNGLVRVNIGGRSKAIRRPRPFIPHPEVPPPNHDTSSSTLNLGQERARGYVQRGEIVVHPHPCIGAIQGTEYQNTRLFRAEAHLDGDVGQPLLAQFERHRQENIRFPPGRRMPRLRDIQDYGSESVAMTHSRNTQWQYGHGRHMDETTRAMLAAERVEVSSDYGLEYESCYGQESSDEDDQPTELRV